VFVDAGGHGVPGVIAAGGRSGAARGAATGGVIAIVAAMSGKRRNIDTLSYNGDKANKVFRRA
jgi:hypothetical protein